MMFFNEVTAYTANGNSVDIGLGTLISMVCSGNVVSAPTAEGSPDMISLLRVPSVVSAE